MGDRLQPVLAGVVTAVVGFASSFTVVLAGLRAVGASETQAASGLLTVSVAAGICATWLGLRHRMPIAIAWSTPGAALLVATGPVPGGWPAAVGAFALCGLLIVAAGLFPALGRAVAAIPAPVAAAMLAGVLLPLCTAPVRALVEVPTLAGPVIVTWLMLHRFARRWAVPAALVVAALAIVLTTSGVGVGVADLRPVVSPTVPTFTLPAVVGLALPLFLVTMAAQNVPGTAVLRGYGYRPPLASALRATGLASALGAATGGHAVNLAAITAALAAGPDAHPDPDRRWIASVTAGIGLALLGLGAGAATTLVLLSPPVLIEAVAGLALLGALAGALSAALSTSPIPTSPAPASLSPASPSAASSPPAAVSTPALPASGAASAASPVVADPPSREAAVVTFVVTASGVSLLGVGGAFWGLLAGWLMLLLFRRRTPPLAAAPVPAPTETTVPAGRAGAVSPAGATTPEETTGLPGSRDPEGTSAVGDQVGQVTGRWRSGGAGGHVDRHHPQP